MGVVYEAEDTKLAVASGSSAFRVRVWQIMSRGQGLGARRSPPEGASVGYSLILRSSVGWKLLDSAPLWRDLRAHRATRVALHVITSPTECESDECERRSGGVSLNGDGWVTNLGDVGAHTSLRSPE
jgi:hypothetical protein